ncbi:DUF202 domain-containing protein [uncultured Arthrobacter sp.]|uniref:DUF202 domain-containing protein n=1 Tax=uncultured Arthrobacter sp. TaxID=114050 RepID=UPI002622441B|nr:DUF202 domain-containing protein [uncultured Arthrobacter sp.]
MNARLPGEGEVPRHPFLHGDAGLQPERTDLAWGRTTLAFIVAGAMFLRWMPNYGWFAGTSFVAATVAAFALNLTRRRLLIRAASGIRGDRSSVAPFAALLTSLAVVFLAILGIYTVLFLPLRP